jgi:ketosteroid isomerase-like protein
MARTTEQVFQAHVSAVQSGDVQQVMADYADDAIVMTVDGAFVGKAAIRSFFIKELSSHPIKKASIGSIRVQDDTMLVEWSAETDVDRLPQAVDTYIIQGDKITRHTTWFRWTRE